MESGFIPIIDFGPCGLSSSECTREELCKTGKELLKAFSEVGFVCLKNAGIEQSFVNDVFVETGCFFTSPLKEKQRYKRKAGINFGYIGEGAEITNEENQGDFKEAFNADGASFERGKEEWPDDLAPKFSSMLLEFMRRGGELSMKILNALAVGMELEDEHFFEKCHTLRHTGESYTTGRILYYPPITKTLNENQTRCGAHADEDSITLLYQDQAGGLQVQNAAGEYVDATPIEGAVFVNIGNILQHWTKGRLKSTMHRVVVPSDKTKVKTVRRSLIYFLLPNHDVTANEPLVYKDESMNETPEEKAARARGEILTPKQLVENRIRYWWNKKA